MAPPTKVVRMERELVAGCKAVRELRELEYLAAAARVKVHIHIRRAHKLGAAFRAIEADMDVPRSTAERICNGPEPEMPTREIA